MEKKKVLFFFSLLFCFSSLSLSLPLRLPKIRCDNAINGPHLFVDWVTNGSPVSYWDNHKQIAKEVEEYGRNIHPIAEATRVDIRKYVVNSPPGWGFFMNFMGRFDECPDVDCYPMIAGISPLPPTKDSHCNTRLHSYSDNRPQRRFINCLFANDKDASKCKPLDFNDLEENGYNIDYQFGFNSTVDDVVFYGEAEGYVAEGLLKMVVYETIASSYVAPLEIFYNASTDECYTPYTDPVVYRVLKKPGELKE